MRKKETYDICRQSLNLLFKERLENIENAKSLKGYSGDFVVVYSDTMAEHIEDNPQKIFALSLCSQQAICPSIKRRVYPVTHIAVYTHIDENGNHTDDLRRLWILRSLAKEENPWHLSYTKIKKLFPKFEIKLGKLVVDHLHCNAWQLKNGTKVFYILWHNGCCISGALGDFTEKPFSELRTTYTSLRFAQTCESGKVFRVTCG